MVFVVKSAISNFNRRNAIRHTWGNVKIYKNVIFQTVFVLGGTYDSNLMHQISQENHLHGDILQFNVNDTAGYVIINQRITILLHIP